MFTSQIQATFVRVALYLRTGSYAETAQVASAPGFAPCMPVVANLVQSVTAR